MAAGLTPSSAAPGLGPLGYTTAAPHALALSAPAFESYQTCSTWKGLPGGGRIAPNMPIIPRECAYEGTSAAGSDLPGALTHLEHLQAARLVAHTVKEQLCARVAYGAAAEVQACEHAELGREVQRGRILLPACTRMRMHAQAHAWDKALGRWQVWATSACGLSAELHAA